MKNTQQNYHVVLFIRLYKAGGSKNLSVPGKRDSSILFCPWIKPQSVSIQVKPNEQHFTVVLFIMLYKVVLTFESVGES